METTGIYYLLNLRGLWPQQRACVLLFITPLPWGWTDFRYIIYRNTAYLSLFPQHVTECRVCQPFSACITTRESLQDDVSDWTSVNVKEESLFGLKSGFFIVMENVFTVAGRRDICATCKSAWSLSAVGFRKDYGDNQHASFSNNFPLKAGMWHL